jgi:hypothetical protein
MTTMLSGWSVRTSDRGLDDAAGFMLFVKRRVENYVSTNKYEYDWT